MWPFDKKKPLTWEERGYTKVGEVYMKLSLYYAIRGIVKEELKFTTK